MLQSKYTLSLDWLKIDMIKTVAAVATTISLTLFTDCNGNTIGLYIQRYCTVTELVHCDVINLYYYIDSLQSDNVINV